MLPRAYAQAYCTNGIPCHQPQSAKPLTRASEHMGQPGRAVGSVPVSQELETHSKAWQAEGWRAEQGMQLGGAKGIY